MAKNDSKTPTQEEFSEILLQVQFLSPEEKKDIEVGKKIAHKIYSRQTSDASSLNYFAARAAKWTELNKWAKGTQDMTQFLPYFNIINQEKSHTLMDMTPLMTGVQFVGTLQESMAKNDEYPSVSAVDDGSMGEKEQRRLEAMFRMKHVQQINQLQQASGLQFEPDGVFVPDDELSADVHFKFEDKLPKEILFEEKLQTDMDRSDYEKIYKRKALRDLICNNIEVNKIERYYNGDLYFRRVIPENVIYNFFIEDNGKEQISYIGELYYLKVKDIRAKYGKTNDNPNGLDEKALYDIARLSTAQTGGAWSSNYLWREEYRSYQINRPWDDFSCLIFDFEIQVEEADYYVNKKDSRGNDNITSKKSKPNPTSDNATVYEKSKNSWMRGVYIPRGDKMVYWGNPDVTIPQYSLSDLTGGYSSYTINIPNNDGRYVPSLFERAFSPLKKLALVDLKVKQLISKIRPDGIRIDVESARNIFLGSGEKSLSWEDVVTVFDQTGNELYSSKGLDPLERGTPAISQIPQDSTLSKVMELTNVANSIMAEIRQLIGVPQYRDGSDVGERTASKLADAQNAASYNVTDYIQNAHHQVMEETLYKMCLLHWQDVVLNENSKEDSLINTVFDVSVLLKSSEYERDLLEKNIAQWSQTPDAQGNPVLSPKDVLVIRNTKNIKLQQLYLSNIVEQNKKQAQVEKEKLVQQNAQSQQQSANQAAQQAQQLQQQKMQMEAVIQEAQLGREKEKILLQGLLGIFEASAKSGAEFPEVLKPLLATVISNVSMPLVMENQDIKGAMNHQTAHNYAIAQQVRDQAIQQNGNGGQLQQQAQNPQQGGQQSPPQAQMAQQSQPMQQ
jgi:hypothetical protein